MLKKLLLVGMVLFTLNTGALNVIAATNDIKIIVDGNPIVSDVAPTLDSSSGRVLVPMRAIFEALGYEVEWDDEAKLITTTLDTTTKVVFANVDVGLKTLNVTYSDFLNESDKDDVKYYNNFQFGVPLTNENTIKTIDGRTMLPTRLIAESLGSKVTWNGEKRIVEISTLNSKIVPLKEWEKALSDHYKIVSPNYLYNPSFNFDGAYDSSFTFNGVKGGNIIKMPSKPVETIKQARTQLIIIGKDNLEKDLTPVDTANGTIYKTYDYFWGKVYEYSYKNPISNAPVVGSFPAKILIDESKKDVNYFDSNKKTVMNLTPEYNINLLSLGGCNWYAESRFWEVTGIPIPHFKESQAKEFWKTNEYLDIADKYNELLALRDVNDVQSNSIALFTTGTTSHVLYVEYVERDSSGKPVNVYFTEANLGGNGTYRYGVDGKVEKRDFEYFKTLGKQQYQGCITANTEFYK